MRQCIGRCEAVERAADGGLVRRRPRRCKRAQARQFDENLGFRLPLSKAEEGRLQFVGERKASRHTASRFEDRIARPGNQRLGIADPQQRARFDRRRAIGDEAVRSGPTGIDRQHRSGGEIRIAAGLDDIVEAAIGHGDGALIGERLQSRIARGFCGSGRNAAKQAAARKVDQHIILAAEHAGSADAVPAVGVGQAVTCRDVGDFCDGKAAARDGAGAQFAARFFGFGFGNDDPGVEPDGAEQ